MGLIMSAQSRVPQMRGTSNRLPLAITCRMPTDDMHGVLGALRYAPEGLRPGCARALVMLQLGARDL